MHCGSDFLLLAERLRVISSRAYRLLAQHLDEACQVENKELIDRSFLTHEMQIRYQAVVADRRRALAQKG